MAAPALSLKARALRLLAQRDHSRSELRRKLLPHAQAACTIADPPVDAPGPCLDKLLDWLEAHRYLSQERFIESRVHARQARFGNLRIQHELAQHGLALDAAGQQALKGSELQRAQAVWRRKFEAPADTSADRARQMRFLAGRGFSAEVIRRVVRGQEDD